MAGNSKSGRRRQPEAIRALKGSKTRSYHKNEPSYNNSIPEAPAFIASDNIAISKWNILSERLCASRVLTEADGEMLALLCMAWADLERLREQYAAMNYQPLIIDEVNTDGESRQRIKPNPLIQLIREASFRVSRFLGEFGLTPMTRAKINSSGQPEIEDPFSRFLTDDSLYSPDNANKH